MSPVPIFLLGSGFLVAGVLIVIFAAPVSRVFYSAGYGLFGARVADKTYTPRNARIAGVAWIAFGILLLAFGFADVIGLIYFRTPNP